MPGKDTTPRENPVIGPPTETPGGRGRLKIFLGFAAGTGKTYAMLDEARRRKGRGQDVVVGVVDPHGRKDTTDHLTGIEEVPPRITQHEGKAYREVDVEGVIARKPQLVLVDELAHTNAPGSPRKQRWE